MSTQPINTIKTDKYTVDYDEETKTISFEGSLRLSGIDKYAPIAEILESVANQNPPAITLNLIHLDVINSSGISMLSKFVIKIKKNQEIKIIIKGSKNIPWQEKSMNNLQRLMPSLTLEME